jgi:hypothetical protein
MLETSVLVEQLPALQEDSAVSWMTKESSVNLWLEKVFCHLQRFQMSKPSPAVYLVPTEGGVAGPGSNTTSLCLVPRLRMCGAVCAIPPHPSIPSMCDA